MAHRFYRPVLRLVMAALLAGGALPLPPRAASLPAVPRRLQADLTSSDPFATQALMPPALLPFLRTIGPRLRSSVIRMVAGFGRKDGGLYERTVPIQVNDLSGKRRRMLKASSISS